MNELKVFDIVVAEEGYCEGFVKYRRAVYDKVEADTTIEELKQKLHDAEMRADLAECAVTEYKIDYDKLKSEVDKVIEESEESHKKEIEQLLIEIVKLNEGAQNLILDNYLKDEKVRHSNYKRCVAMYRYCSIKALYELDFKDNDVKWKWYSKWMHKWYKLAEKFKEAKETLEPVEKANTLYKEAK